MAADDKWYFTKEQLQNTPSRKCGLDADKELSYRQQAANFIQDMGQKLQVSQLCINTAIVYMHRFYMFHSFTHFPWNTIAAAAFFLAAKVEEQPRKLEHVIRIANHCLHREQPVVFDAKSEQYAAQSQDLVFNENVLLQTLGFDVAIDHPHTHVVRCCHLVRASIDLSKTSYFMASNSLHLTTMCLQYKPTVVACFCIHLASKWSSWQIPKSNEGKDWYYYVDKTVTAELLEQLTLEFLKIFDKCPSRLKRKITSISNHNSQNIDQLHAAATSAGSPFDPDSRKYHSLDTSKDGGGSSSFHRSHHDTKQALLSTPETSDVHKKPPRPHDQQQRADYREYREKKERERLEREKVTASSSQHHKSSSSTSSTSSSSSLGVIPGPIPQTGNSKHLPASKPHHRPPPPAGIDQTKMKMHHRPNEIHREHQQQQQQQQQQQKDMTNGRDRYIQQQQQQQSDKQKVPDTNKLPPKYDPNRHRRDLDPKYAQQQQQQQQQQKVPSSRDSVSSVSVVDKQKLAAAANSSNSVQQDSKNFLNKQINSTSQRHKSPFTEINKPSVPVATTVASASASASAPSSASATTSSNIAKNDSRNGSHWPQQQELPQLLEKLDDGLLSPVPTTPTTTTTSTVTTKKSSLFSPEKTPPQQQTSQLQPQQSQSQKKWTTTPVQQQQPPPPPISPFGSPPPIQSHPKLQTPTSLRRSRTSSSGSEPELRPVLKKLDQISGFENINSKMGIKLAKVPDIIQPICDRTPVTAATATNTSSLSTDSGGFLTKELKVPEIIKPFQNPNNDTSTANIIHNGIETDPAVISTLLKEAVNPTQLAAQDEPINVQMPLTPAITPIEFTDKYSVKGDHHHKSEKKKKKDKHKHKDKDKGRDEKKKKHKDKDKERRKDKLDGGSSIATTTMDEVPLKITISKKNAEQPVITSVQDTIVATTGLKVKISRDKIKPDSIGGGSSGEVLAAPPVQTAPSTLKIKISKDQIQYNSVVDAATTQTNSSSRKRDRDRDKGQQAAAGGGQPPGVPPTKIMKSSYGGGRDSRQNGKNYYNKVSNYNLNNAQNQNARGRFNVNMAPMVQQQQQVQQQQPPPMYQQQQQQQQQYFVHNYMQPHGYMFATPDQMYHAHQQYYQGYQMYHPPTHDMYMQPPPIPTATASNAEGPPPLPDGPPPDAPPPPPPE